MGGGSTPAPAATVAPPPVLPTPPTAPTQQPTAAQEQQINNPISTAQGQQQTILTRGDVDTDADVTKKSLLGS